MNFNFQNKIILATLLVAFSFLLRKEGGDNRIRSSKCGQTTRQRFDAFKRNSNLDDDGNTKGNN
jgi:hypothetical protein